MEIKQGDTVTVDFPGSRDGSSKPVNATGTAVLVGEYSVIVEFQNGERKLFHPAWVTKK